MTNLFKIKIKCSEGNFERFKLAFKDLYALSKLLCSSENTGVKQFIEGIMPGDPPWIAIGKQQVIIKVEDSEVIISDHDFKLKETIEYNFRTRLPADDVFIFAVISIIKHYIKDLEICNEVEHYKQDFDDGVRLARIVNPKINNPYRNTNIIYNTPYTKYIEKICKALSTSL